MADDRVINALVSAREELHKTDMTAGNFVKQHPDSKNAAKIGLFSEGVKESKVKLDALLRVYSQQPAASESATKPR